MAPVVQVEVQLNFSRLLFFLLGKLSGVKTLTAYKSELLLKRVRAFALIIEFNYGII